METQKTAPTRLTRGMKIMPGVVYINPQGVAFRLVPDELLGGGYLKCEFLSYEETRTMELSSNT
jgi:hypothetical protein